MLPRLLVDLGFERGFERAVGIVCAEEIGVADEEAFLVVVGVDEPAGDAFGAVAADFAGLGSKTSTPFTLTRSCSSFSRQERDVGLAEDDKEVAFAGVLEIVGHVQIGVHARLENRDAAQLVESAGMRVVVEGAGDQDVEVGIAASRAARRDRDA